MEEKNLKDALLCALKHVGCTIVYYLFIVPFVLWKQSCCRLAKQYGSKELKIKDEDNPYQYILYQVRVLVNFLFDLFIFLSVFIGVIFAIYSFIDALSNQASFGDAFIGFLLILVGSYYAPAGISIFREIFMFFVNVLIRPLLEFILLIPRIILNFLRHLWRKAVYKACLYADRTNKLKNE